MVRGMRRYSQWWVPEWRPGQLLSGVQLSGASPRHDVPRSIPDGAHAERAEAVRERRVIYGRHRMAAAQSVAGIDHQWNHAGIRVHGGLGRLPVGPSVSLSLGALRGEPARG